jgi:hypothetical protein
MKQAATHIALSITGIMVKTYMVFGLAWSKADAEYRKLKGTSMNTLPTRIKAQPAV